MITAVYDQHLSDLNETSSVLDEVWKERPHFTLEEMHGHLGRFLFSGEDVHKPVERLSGGEKARVALAKLFLKDANLLLLDEPTNHLDLIAREALENALSVFSGSILLVTHDRYLLDRIAVKIWSLENRTFDEYPGNYSEYKQSIQFSRDAVGNGLSENNSPKKSRKDKRIARMEIRKQTGKSAAYYEREIAVLEAELAHVRNELSNPDISHVWTDLNELVARETGIEQEIVKVMDLWEKAVEAETGLEE